MMIGYKAKNAVPVRNTGNWSYNAGKTGIKTSQ
jgi:hypothetical protein